MRIGVTGGVEPVAGPVFTVGRRGHELVDQRTHLCVVQAATVLGEVLGEKFRRRREAGDVECQAANERAGVGLGGGLKSGSLELGEDEAVDGVLGPAALIGGGRDCDGRHEGPVRLPFGPLFDPSLNRGDLFWPERLVRLRWRHDLIFVFGDNALVEATLVGLSLDDGWRLLLAVLGQALGEEASLGVEAKAGLARAWIWAVAVEAVVGDHRADVAIELDFLIGRKGNGYEEGQECQEGLRHGLGVS